MIGIFSDIHGHAPALQKTISVLLKHGAQKLYFLGDALGYIPSIEPLEILQKTEELTLCLRGNHEDMILTGYYHEKKSKIYKTKDIYAQLRTRHFEYIKGWPLTHTEVFISGRALFAHGTPSDPLNGYAYPDTELGEWCQVDADIIFMGHTHRPFIRLQNGKKFVNVGSCGLPRDHGAWGAAALFDERTGEVRIVRFSIEKETETLIEKYNTQSPSVAELFKRENLSCVGEYVDVQ